LNGAFWIIKPDRLTELSELFLSGDSYGFEMEESDSIYVDTPLDLAMAEFSMRYSEERFSWAKRGGFNLQRLYVHDDPHMGITRNILDSAAYEKHFQRYNFFLKHIKPSDSILDIACGSGYGSEILSSKASTVLGVDTDSRTIEYARRQQGHITEKYQVYRRQAATGLDNRVRPKKQIIGQVCCFHGRQGN
jgi:SAM-dependent methyltransferase